MACGAELMIALWRNVLTVTSVRAREASGDRAGLDPDRVATYVAPTTYPLVNLSSIWRILLTAEKRPRIKPRLLAHDVLA